MTPGQFSAVLLRRAQRDGLTLQGTHSPMTSPASRSVTSSPRSTRAISSATPITAGSRLRRSPDRSAAGTFLDLIIRNDQRLTAIFAELHGRTNLTVEEGKLRDLYEAFMDTTQIEASALKPAAAELTRIDEAASLEDVARILGDPALRLQGPFDMRIQVDDKNPDAYLVRLTQSARPATATTT
jgi:hypothetical protein